MAEEKVGALGRLNPSGGFIDVWAPPGYRIIEIRAKEDDVIEKGMPIVTLRKANPNKTAFALAQLSVKEADELGKKLIELQKLRVREADELGKRAIELKKLEILKAKLDCDYFERTLNRLLEGGSETYSVQKKEDCDYNVKAAKAKLDLATRELDRLILDHQIRLALATRELDRLILDHEISLSRAKQNLEAAEKEMMPFTLTAPVYGTILDIFRKVGETTDGKPILRMANLQQMDVTTEVFEGDLLKLSAGMKAVITSNSLPNGLTGTVVAIGRIVSDRSKNGKVVIRLDDSEVASKLINMEVNVSIKLR